MNVKPLFKLMVEKRASDLFFTTYAPVMIKIDGKIIPGQPDGADAEDGPPGRARAHERVAARGVHARSRDRLRDLRGRPRPVPRQYLPPARQRRDGAAFHHARAAQSRRARHAGDPQGHGDAAARPDFDGRRERLGQVDDARGDDRSPQRPRRIAYRHDRGSDRVSAHEPEIDRQSARGRARYAFLRGGPAQRDARGARRRADRRDPGPQDDAGRDRPGRHGAPLHRDAAREQLARDARSNHQHVSERSAQAGAHGLGPVRQGHHFSASRAIEGRQARRRRRGHAQHAASSPR